MVDEKDREAYEQGVEDSKHPISTSFNVLRTIEYTGSAREAYEKGLRGEQFDEDEGGLEKKT